MISGICVSLRGRFNRFIFFSWIVVWGYDRVSVVHGPSILLQIHTICFIVVSSSFRNNNLHSEQKQYDKDEK